MKKTVHRHIRRGMSGPDVRRFQEELNISVEKGLVPGRTKKIAEDGRAGVKTFRLAAQVAFWLGCPRRTMRNLKRGIAGKWCQSVIRNPHKRTEAMAVRRKNRLKKRKQTKGRLSPHFHIDEFACKDGRKVPEKCIPALKDLCLNHLEPLRSQYGPCGVTSGYRPADYNARIGGEDNSLHIYDYPGRNCKAVAADTTFRNGSASSWSASASRTNPDGLGTYIRSNFIHQDNRGRVGMAHPARWSG